MEKVTVVIPTYNNRIECLENLLQVLNKESLSVVILNTSSTDYKTKYKNVKVLKIPNLLKAKNYVISLVKTPWILFLDDDLVLKGGEVKAFLNHLNKERFDAASGLVKENNPRYSFPDPLYFYKYATMTFYKVGCLNHKKPLKKCAYNADFLPGGFLFVKTDALKKICGFNENYIFPFYNEDTDLTVRIKGLGLKLLVIPTICVLHLKESGGVRTKIAETELYYAFGFNNCYFITNNWGIWYYMLYSIFRCRDHLHVLKKLNTRIYKSYLKGIINGYKKSRS
jgi:GT2 family glycosyltransferase